MIKNPVVVQFVKSYQSYNAGETAGFMERHAKRLVDDGIAVKVEVVKEVVEEEVVESIEEDVVEPSLESDIDDSEDSDDDDYEIDVSNMNWEDLKAYVKELTGKVPRSKERAYELITEYSEDDFED